MPHAFEWLTIGAILASAAGSTFVDVRSPWSGAELLGVAPGKPDRALAAAGEKLFDELGCSNCHLPDAMGVGPSLVGVFGRPVLLKDGVVVTATEAYLRESILDPPAKVVAGFDPIMPTFPDLITDEGLRGLLEYVKSLEVAGLAELKSER